MVVGVADRTEQTWQERAACRGPDSGLFFPPGRPERRDEREEREQRAKSICARCAVLEDCRDFALSIREQHGIWGGLTESERRALVAPARDARPRRSGTRVVRTR